MERRRSRRIPLEGMAALQFEGTQMRVAIIDISVTGIAFRLLGEQPRRVHGLLGTCRVDAPDLACPIDAFVSVMRQHPLRDGTTMLGCRFESISDDHLMVVRAYISLFSARQRRHVRQQPTPAAVAA